MSLISPFVCKQHIPETNVGTMMLAIAKGLDDKSLIDWANTLDWSEPVVSVKRFENAKDRQFGGYQTVDMSTWHLVEILVMTGDHRIVETLLSKDRLPESFDMPGTTLRKNSYMDVPIDVALVNAAIRTGSTRILEMVVDLVMDQKHPSINQWFSDSRYSPFVCLADQRHMAVDQLFSMWKVLEKNAFSSGEKMGRGFGKKMRESFRERGIFEASRLGNASLVEKLSLEFNLPITGSMWVNLLDEGNIGWCANWLCVHDKLAQEKSRHGNSWAKDEIKSPVSLLASKAIEQVKTTMETFKNHENLSVNTKTARGNVRLVLDLMISARGGGSLLDASDRVWCGVIAPMVVRYDAALATEQLNLAEVPLSVEEGVSYALLPFSADAMSFLENRISTGLENSSEITPENTMRELVAASNGEINAAMVARLLSSWKILNIDDWGLPGDFASEIKAHMMAQSSPQISSDSKPTRRM